MGIILSISGFKETVSDAGMHRGTLLHIYSFIYGIRWTRQALSLRKKSYDSNKNLTIG